MKLQVLYFASLRESVGIARETVEPPESVVTVGELRQWLIGRGGAWASALATDRAIRMAVNHAVTGADTALVDGGEVAFFPPVTGG
ncbi:MAG: molybdopterin converting factor subunit 1 [Burkholderiaceae bacterium]